MHEAQPVALDDEEQAPAPVAADRERDYDAGRLMAFSDGVFAIAITLLVLNVSVPLIVDQETKFRLPASLLSAGPPLLTFALSFFLVGFYWIRHHQLFRELVKVNVWLLWLNLVVLFLVCLLPFSAGVVTRNYRTVGAAEVYALNLAAIALAFTGLYLYAIRTGQVRRPPGLGGVWLLGQGVLQPFVVTVVVMVLAPWNPIATYVVGALLMAVVGVYTTVPQAIRSAPLAGLREGRLRFSRPVAHVAIGADAEMPELFRAQFAGPEPEVTVAGNAVDVAYRRVSPWAWRPQLATIALNHRIPWRVEALGGALALRADLTALDVRAVTVAGGAIRSELRLPPPTGTVPIQFRGGADAIVIRHPRGTAVRAVVHGGVATLKFDGQVMKALAVDASVNSPEYDTATDRYDIDIEIAARTLDIEAI